MKTLLSKGLFFIASFIGVYLILFAILFFLQPGGIPFVYRATQGNLWEGGGTWLKFKNFDTEKKWDAIVLGSSHAYRGYNPEVFNSYKLDLYNLGTSNQHMMCTYYIVKNFISKDNCKLLILDMFDKVFTNNDIESKSDIIQNVNDDKTAIEIAISSNDIRAINMITLRYFNKTMDPLNIDTLGYNNGFLVSRKILDPKKKDLEKMKWKYKGDEGQKKYLNLLLAHCKKNGIKIVAVSHPAPQIYPMVDHDKFLKDVVPLFEKHEVKYYDYTHYPQMGSINYYSDPTHLNHIGAIKFNKIFINDLINDGVISN
ncbi:MAG: hypothetical protein IPK10_04500 [Bacteroidetes bacterium]|nr:hypothetical protein [Bacteroidota bacterium]